MAYYWKCKKHNEIMVEKLDDTRTKIIPYCTYCEAENKLENIVSKQSKKYYNEFNLYTRHLDRLSELTLTAMASLYIAVPLVMLGIVMTLVFIITKEFLGALVGIFLFILGGVIIFPYFSYKEPEKPSYPTIDSLISQNTYFINSLQNEVNQYKERLKISYKYKVKNLDEVDMLDGFEFEEYVANLLLTLGYKEAIVTQKSGDFGADILAVNSNDIRVAIQCKRYGTQNSVGNDAIQQIHSAMDYFDYQKAMVITTSYFSKPAFQMAQKLEVELWDREILFDRIASISQESWNDYLSRYYIKPEKQITKIPVQ